MRQKNEKGYRVVWYGLEDEKAAKAFYQTLLEFRVEKTCKVIRDIGIQREEVLSLIKEHINGIDDAHCE